MKRMKLETACDGFRTLHGIQPQKVEGIMIGKGKRVRFPKYCPLTDCVLRADFVAVEHNLNSGLADSHIREILVPRRIIALDAPTWTVVVDPAAGIAARGLARGSYQRSIVDGFEALSGSTLRGKAADWRLQYKISKASLLHRLHSAGIPFSIVRAEHPFRRNVLVIGD